MKEKCQLKEYGLTDDSSKTSISFLIKLLYNCKRTNEYPFVMAVDQLKFFNKFVATLQKTCNPVLQLDFIAMPNIQSDVVKVHSIKALA
ncbi:hypothetical protein PCE01_02360 [Pediococcus cellicola]|nr:hypothetical protein PCE01_02360 [Pediococcus cellicola]